MADTRTPEEIERDIERERAQLTNTIDTLQDRFSLDGMARQVSEHLRDNGGEIARNFSATIKENPVAVALVGAGLAWLALGNSSAGRQIGAYASTATRRVTGEDEAHVESDYSRAPRPAMSRPTPAIHADHPGDSLPATSARRFDAANPTRSRDLVLDDDPDMDWYYDDLDDDDRYGFADKARDSLSAASGAVGGAARSAGDTAQGAASSVAHGAKSAAQSVASGAKSAASAVGQGASSAASGAAGVASSVASGARSAAGAVADGTRSVAGSVSETASAAYARLAQGTETLSEEARDRVVRARRAALKAKERASDYSRSAVDHTSEVYDRQPLAFGALAFAIGAAAAASLPSTRREDEAFGAHSDRLYRRAQRILEDEKRKAEAVAQSVKQEVRSIAADAKREIDHRSSDVRAAVEDAADKAVDAAKRVADKAKTEAERQKLGSSVKSD